MANIFVDDSKTGGNDDGTDWDNAFLSMASADGGGSTAADEIRMAYTHTEGWTVETTLDFSGGDADNPVKIVSCDPADDTYRAGAKIDITNANALILNGNFLMEGVTLDCDDLELNRSSNDVCELRDCTLTLDGTILTGAAENHTTLENCTINGTSSGIGGLIWINQESGLHLIDCTITEDGSGTVAFRVTYDNANLLCESCDLSGMGATLTRDWGDTGRIDFAFRKCRLPASWVANSDTVSQRNARLLIEDCDDGTITVPPMGLQYYEDIGGTVEQVLTHRRTGGANDDENANAYSWKMVGSSSSAVEHTSYLTTPPIAVWVDPDSSPSSATAQGIFTTTRMTSIRSTPSAIATDDTTPGWTGSGTGTVQKLELTLTNGNTLRAHIASAGALNDDDFWWTVQEPDQVGGFAFVRFHLAKAVTVYVCPLLDNEAP